MRTLRLWRCLLLLAGACLCASPAAAQVLISEIYYKGPEAPGWNSYWSRSYVELRNAGDNPVDLSGWGLRYWGTSDPGVVVPLSGVLPAGARYLVAFGAQHPVPINMLPTPDVSSAVEMVRRRSFAVLDASNAVQDLVGVDFDAPAYETRSPYVWEFLALARRLDGCFDSNDGFWDFKGRYGEPQNSSAPAVPCGPPPPCTFTLSPTAVTLQAQWPAAGFQLRAPEHCLWTAQGPPWITFSETQWIGDLDVTIQGEIFESGPTRTGTITFGNGSASVSATVTQPPKTPCVFAFTPSSPQAFGPEMGIRTVAVATQAHCSMNPVASGNWLYPRGYPTMGPGDFMFQVGPLATGSRTGTFTIGGAVLTIVQDSQGTPDVSDADQDTLIDAWERRFGLDPAVGGGSNGTLGDPDSDGVTNFQEQIQGSHPLGLSKRFFAEGVANQFFQTTIALFTPDPQPATVQLQYMTEFGEMFSELVTIPGRTRRTFTPGAMTGITGKSFSTTIESTGRVVADRTVVWGAGGYGAHAETGLQARSSDWYLAEGSTSGDFSLFYLLQNPTADPVNAAVRFLLPGGGPPIEKTYVLVPFSRLTVPVDAVDPLLASTDVSAAIHASAPIVVERAMYLSKPDRPFLAGHESAGVITPTTEWFLAEGSTGAFFDAFILIANPGTQSATATVDYLLSDGRTFQKTYALRPESRTTIWVDTEEIPAGSGAHPLASVNVSARIVASQPIVVERTMWWPGPAASADFWYEAHNSPGAQVATGAWAMAEGIVGTAAHWDTYVLIANTSTTAATVVVTAFPEQGQSSQRTFVIAPLSRFTVSMSDGFGLADQRFATLVEGGIGGSQLVVERAMYSTAGGVVWSAGTNALATPIP